MLSLLLEQLQLHYYISYLYLKSHTFLKKQLVITNVLHIYDLGAKHCTESRRQCSI